MTTAGEKVVLDKEWDVYRIKKPDGVLAGTEYGGYPLGWESRSEAQDALERRAGLAEDLLWFRTNRRRLGWTS